MSADVDLSQMAAATQRAGTKAAQTAATLGNRRVDVELPDRSIRATMTYHGVLEELTIGDDLPRKLGSAELARLLETTLRAAQERAASAYEAAVHEAAPEIGAYQRALMEHLGVSVGGREAEA